ncbi:MAG: ATP synthase F0 subunit C [Candidatus Babeliaceae bacterium]|nr:ATP synthase F0 subunit C [Candidatus Babeliaceae bacterium]
MEDMTYIVKAVSCIAAGLAISIGTLGPAIAQGLVASKACENIGKYPESASSLRTMMMIALAFIETLAIYVLAIAALLLFL